MKTRTILIGNVIAMRRPMAFYGPADDDQDIPETDSDEGPGEKKSAFAEFVMAEIEADEAASRKQDKKPDDKQEEEEEKKEDDKKEEEEKKEPTEFDPVEFDETALVTKKGKPVSVNVTEVIKKFKAAAKESKAVIEKLQQEAKTNQTANIEEDPKYKEILAERDKLRDVVDTEYFYESDSFKSKYIEPVTKAQATVKKYTESLEEDDKEEIRPLLAKATAAMKEGNETAFDKALDEASELFTPSTARKFSNAMGELWDAHNEYSEALKDKEKAKVEISKKKDSTLSGQVSTVATLLKESTDRFFEINKDVVTVFETDENLKKDFNYKESVTKSAEAVTGAIKVFNATGEITQELRAALVKSTQYDAILKEREVQGGIIRAQMQTEVALRAEIKKLSDRVIALSSPDASGRHRNIDEKDKKEAKKGSGSILYDALVDG